MVEVRMRAPLASLLLPATLRLGWAPCFALLALTSGQAIAQQSSIVVLGDSNTQGYGVAPQQAFPAGLEAQLGAAGHSLHVVNAGVAGDTFGGLLSRVDSQVPPGTRVVVVQAGYNDLHQGVPPNVSIANMSGVLARVQARGATAVLCGFFSKKWDAVGRSLAARYNAIFVPGSTCYDPIHVGPDGLHMSAVGHQIVAARLARVVEPLVGTQSQSHAAVVIQTRSDARVTQTSGR
jgi:acyl-CoA thioesterase I